MTPLETPLDAAWTAAEAPGAHPQARARFYALLLETTLRLPVENAEADPLKPMVFPLSDGDAALAFDDEARMAAFFDAPVEYVEVSGRALARLAAEAGLALGLNLGDAPSATLLGAPTVRWLADEAAVATAAAEARGAVTVAPPGAVDPGLPAALAGRLAGLPGFATEAWLVRLTVEDAAPAPAALVALTPAAGRGAEGVAAALAAAAAPHIDGDAPLQVSMLAAEHPAMAAARRVGIALHAPPERPPERQSAPPAAGRAPAAPPKLR